MGRRKVENRNIRKVSKMGNGSTYVTLPVELVRELGWRERQKVVVHRSGTKLVIEDWK